MPKLNNLIGKRFGKLIVIERAPSKRQKCGKLTTYWLCKCDCGNTKIIRHDRLKGLKNCGCERNKKNLYKIPKLYTMRNHMIKRCYDKSEPAYKNYGKRGISVCDEWLDEENGLNNFCKWALSNGYNPNAKFQECTLDRIDVNGDYEPDNCRFVSNYVQARNKTNNIYITYNGETKILADWAKYFNFPPNLFRFRYLKGWDIDRIVNTPRKRRNMK